MKRPVDGLKVAPCGRLFAARTSVKLGSGSVALTVNSIVEPVFVDFGPRTVSLGWWLSVTLTVRLVECSRDVVEPVMVAL